MKKINFLILFTITSLLVNCSSEEKKNEKKNDLENKQLELIVEFKSQVNDRFKVYYTVAPNVEITGEYMLTNYTFGSNELQKTVFKFPSGEVPYKIRLDVGENQLNDRISIKNISINYNNKVIDGDNGKFMPFWALNECIKYDENNFIYNIIPLNGKKGPVLVGNTDLEEELLKLYK
jgi:hypothetical protein